MDPTLIDRLHDDLDAAGYRAEAVRSLLGAEADEARQRGALIAARKELARRDDAPLILLVRLLLLGEALTKTAIDQALPRLGCQGALSLGLLGEDEDAGHRAVLALNPVSLPDLGSGTPRATTDWWVLSDLDDQLRLGPAEPDHVVGVGGATRSLLALALIGSAPGLLRPRNALDLGTGCGIIALVLARAGVPRVVASDISVRALRLARANARLNGLSLDSIEFVQGDLYDPVAGQRFDLILSNPPFVITPRADGGRSPYTYRDGGMEGDQLAARVIRDGPRLLAEHGTLLCLANWESPWGGDGLDRVHEWISKGAEAADCALDAWAIERDRVAPMRYAETWARDGGARPGSEEFDALLTSWLQDFTERRIVSIGLGSIRIRRRDDAARSVIREEQAPGMLFADGPGPGLLRAFDAGSAAERLLEGEVLDTHWVRTPRVYEEREYVPGADNPRAIRLVVDDPIGRRVDVDPLLAGALGVCDGELSLRQISDALATILEVDPIGCAAELVAGIRELAWLGMVQPHAG